MNRENTSRNTDRLIFQAKNIKKSIFSNNPEGEIIFYTVTDRYLIKLYIQLRKVNPIEENKDSRICQSTKISLHFSQEEGSF